MNTPSPTNQPSGQIKQFITALTAKPWFPQRPIALAVALLGLLHLLPVLDQVFAMQLHLSSPESSRRDLDGVSLFGISQSAVSIFLLMMALGLWKRSRVSWTLAVLAVAVGLTNLMVQSEAAASVWALGYGITLLAVLLATRRYFDRVSMGMGTLSALTALMVVFGFSVFGTYRLGDQFSQPIDSLTDALYVSVVTLSTVGFGDFSPVTREARLFVSSVIVFGITVISTAVGATLIPALVHHIEQVNIGKRKKMNRSEHYIIVGYSALANNTYRELADRGEHVTVILRDSNDRVLFTGTDIDMVTGDGSDLETLSEAGADKAKAVLALLDDDSENAFVVLAVKELQSEVKTVAAVNQMKHLSRVRRVHPDMIIAPQVLGGELLTSMLTGEEIDVKSIMSRLLGQVAES